MSEAVDTRIVEAKFDSAQFEKGVDRTVKKLDELKKSLNLEESGKSITDLAAKTQSATEKASSAIEQLENRFTSFTGMLKQKLLSGIADEIVGVFFKIKNGVESMVRSLSSAQVSVGMSKYEQMLTSVRTMVASGSSETAAYKAIETLGLYADQTSYSLDQMTSALSKMKAAGVGLDTGTKAVEGISNACAIAGINATDASRAFYNLSQAYSSGVLKYTDYRSLELLNMTTLDFKENMLEAAVAAGTLKKTAEGVYKTINTKDKKVTAGKTVTTKNLTDSLRYNFMNTEAMNALFGDKYFFDEEKWKELKNEFKALGKTEEEALAKAKELYGETAVNAYFAAREARSFTDVISTLKDVISRGWSKSFELIFGKLTDAKDFFTWLTENEFAEAIYAIGDFRNNVLEIWSNRGGRDDFIKALENIDEIIGEIVRKFSFFSSGDVDVKAQRLGGILISASRDFANFTAGISDWLNTSTDAKKTRLDRIKDALDVFSTLLKATLRISSIAFNAISNIMGLLSPVFDSIIKLLSKVAVKINEVLNPKSEAYTHFYHILQNIITIGTPFVSVISTIIDVLGDVAAFFVEIAAGTFTSNLEFISDTLGFILEVFTGTSSQKKSGKGVIQGIKDDVVSLGDALKDGLKAIGDFFATLFNDLRKLIGISPKEGEEGGAFAGLKDFFNTNVFIQNVKDEIKDLPNKIKRLFWKKGFSEELYKNIARFDSTSAAKYRNAFKGPFTKLIEAFTKAVKDFVKKVQEKTKDIWNTILDFFLGKRTGETQIVTDDKGNTKVITERVKEGFSKWLDETLDSVKNWMKSIPDKISKLWDSIIDFLFGKEAEPEVVTDEKTGRTTIVINRIKEGFSLWLSNLPENIKKLFLSLKDSLKKVWNTVVDFIFGREATADEISKAKAAGVENINTRVKEGFSLWLSELPDKVMAHIQNTPERIKEVWNKVVDFIFGPKAEVDGIDDAQTEGTVVVDNRIKQGFSLWFYNLTEKVKTWIGEFRANISQIWDTLITAIFGNNNDQKKLAAENKGSGIFGTVTEAYQKKLNEVQEALGVFGGKKNKTIIDTVQDFANTIGTKIAEIISNLPTYIAEKVNFGLSLAGSVFDNISKWFDKVNSDEYRDMFKNNIDSFVKAIQEGDTSGLSPFAIQIIEIGKKISTFIKETIPDILSGAFDFIKEQSDNLYEAITSIFTIENWTAVETKAKSIGETIANHIKKIPEYVALGVKSIQDALTSRHGVGYSETEQAILDQFTDEQGRLAMTTEFRAAMNKSADQIAKEKEGWTIWGVISDIGVAIGDAFVGLGPTILQGINSVITWIGDGLTKVGDWLKGKPSDVKLTDYIDEQVELPENEQYKSIWESAKTLGSTIGNVFTQVIPNFLSTAFNTIVTDLPNIIGQAFSGTNVQEETAKAIETAIGPEKPENASGGGFDIWTFFGGSVAGADEAVSEFGETLDTVNEETEKAVKKTKQIVNKEAELQKLNKERDKLAHEANMSIAGVGQTNAGSMAHNKKFKDLLAQVEAYDEYIEAVKKLEEDQNGNVDIGGLDAEALKKQGGLFTDIGGVVEQFANFATSDTTKAIAVLIGIGYVLSQIKDVLSIADEFESVSDTIKWTALTALILGIVSILGYVTYLASIDTPESDKFEQVTKVFTDLAAFVKELSIILGAIEGVSMFKSFFGMKTASKELKAATDGGSSVIGGLFSNIFSFGGKLLTTMLLSRPLGSAIGDGISELFDGLMVTAQEIGTGVETLMTMLEPGIKKLSGLNADLDAALEAFGKLYDLLGKLRGLIQKENDYAQGTDTATFVSKQFNDASQLYIYAGQTSDSPQDSIQERLEWLYNLTTFIYELSHALEAIEKVKDPIQAMKTAGKIFESDEFTNMMSTLFGGLSKTASFFYDEFDGSMDLKNAGMSMRFFADAMSIFTGSISTLSPEQIPVLQSGMDTIRDLVELMNGENGKIRIKEGTWDWFLGKGDNTIGAFGRVLMSFGGSMETFFSHVEKIDADGSKEGILRTNTDLILMTIRTVSYAAERLSHDLGQKNKLESLNEVFADLGDFGTKLTSFIDQFSKYEGENIPDVSFIIDAMDIVNSIVDIFFIKMKGLDYDNVNEEYNKHYGPRLGMVMKVVQGTFQMFGEIYKMLEQAIERPDLSVDIFKDDAYTTLVESLRYYMTLVEDVVSIMERMKTISYTEDDNPFHIISDSVNILNADFDTISQFVEKVKTLNADDLKSAVSLFQGLESLANAISVFSGDTHETGVDNLRLFNWNGLIKSLSDNMIPALSSKGNVFNEFGEMVGKNIVVGLVQGVRSTVDDAKKSMQDLANAISGTFTMKLEINSPSKLFQRFGQFLGMGLQLGIDDRESLVIASVKNLGTKLLNSFFNGSMMKQVGEGENLGAYLVNTAIDSVMDEVEKNSGAGGKYGLYGMILTNLFGDKADREKTLQYLVNSKDSITETAKGVMGDLKSKLEEVMKESGFYSDESGFGMNLFSYFVGKAKNKVSESADTRKITKEIAIQEASAIQYYRDYILDKKPTDLINVFNRGVYDALGITPIKRTTDAIKDVENEINQVMSDMQNYKGANLARNATDLNPIDVVDAQLEEYEKKLSELRERLTNLQQVEEAFVYTDGKLKDQGFEYRVTPKLVVADTKTAVKETASDLWNMLKDMGSYLKDGMKSFDFNKYMPNIGDFIAIAMNSQEGISNYVARAASQFSSDLGGILSGVIETGTNSALENGLLDNKESFVHLLNEALGVIGYDKLLNKALDIMGSEEESYLKDKLLQLAETINESVQGEDSEFTPVITPVVDMTNVDAAEERLRNFGSTDISGSVGGITMPTTTIDLAGRVIPPNPSEQTNKLNEILNTIASARDGINQFSTSLSNTRFTITGRDLVYSIGPDIDEHIGREVVYSDRQG